MATPPDTQATAPKRELAAIMFSDIAGYTAIMGRDEHEGLEARNNHRELLRTILPRFNGRILGDPGDGALSSFQSAIDAVSCARVFQAATGTDPRFRIRVGIHVGDVLFADNTVLGDGVNIASRIQALAPPRGICISERVFEEIRNQRGMDFSQDGEDFRFAPLGAALHCADEEGELPKVTWTSFQSGRRGSIGHRRRRCRRGVVT